MNAMTKTQKKIDNNIRQALTAACEVFLEEVAGFEWLTHEVNYNNFPTSLIITCVFNTLESKSKAINNADTERMQGLIQAKLLNVGVRLGSPKKQIIFTNDI